MQPLFLSLKHMLRMFSPFCVLSKLDHPGTMKLVAAHARPPNYMFFFELYEAGTLSQKLHVEEHSLSIGQAMEITAQLGMCIDTSKNLNMLGVFCAKFQVVPRLKLANITLSANLMA